MSAESSKKVSKETIQTTLNYPISFIKNKKEKCQKRQFVATLLLFFVPAVEISPTWDNTTSLTMEKRITIQAMF